MYAGIHCSSNKGSQPAGKTLGRARTRSQALDRKEKNTYFLDERLHTDPKILVSIVDDTLEYSDKDRVIKICD